MNRPLWILAGLVLAGLAGAAGWRALGRLERPSERGAEEAASQTEGSAAPRRVADSESASAAPHTSEPATDWGALNNEGVAALRAGDFEAAIAVFERCIEARPDEEVFRKNLAQALIELALALRQDRAVCDECLELLERAAELAPDRADLAQLVDKWRRESAVEEGFWRESSLYFDLAYDGARSAILRDSFRVLDHLDRAYGELRDLFGADPVQANGRRIPVVLYTRGDFDQVTGLGDWAGGAFDGTVRIPIDEDVSLDDANLQRILKHELVHAFVHEVGGRTVPGWLNEGLAQLLEPGAQASVSAARGALAGRELYALEELAGSLATWDDAAAVALAYSQALALCDFVAFQYGDRTLYRMVAGCAAGDAVETTFREITGLELAAAVEELAAGL